MGLTESPLRKSLCQHLTRISWAPYDTVQSMFTGATARFYILI
jgi:hypothetical protein